MAIGAIQAIKEKGLKPGSDILIVGVDGIKDAFKAMAAGDMNCSVECNPILGPQLMKAVQDYMAGKDLPIRMITLGGHFPRPRRPAGTWSAGNTEGTEDRLSKSASKNRFV